MKRSLRLLTLTALTVATAALAGCSQGPAVNRVGVNVVDKSLFTGSWYYSSTVIDVDYAAAGLGTYPGDSAIDFAAGGLGSMPRIRWVIAEDTLFAYRDYEIIEGANQGRDGSTDLGEQIRQPVAAFAIDSHFDIRRDYNPNTGEENNVLVENDFDNFWYERQYMRVDWSQNLLPNYYGQVTELYEILGLYDREPSTLFLQGQSEFPASWRPQFDFMSCAALNDESCSEGDRDLAEEYDQGEFYHFSFVTQDLMSPGTVPNPFTGRPVNYCLSPYAGIPDCAATAVYVRNSFLKVSDRRQYVPENWVDSRFDRHGYFRHERLTYDRATDAGDVQQGFTDFLNYNANRHNIWREWTDEAGNAIPFTDRRTRPLTYYTSTELPAHLVEPSFDLAGAWSVVFMRLVRNLRGQPDMEIPRQECQTADPEAYCYCTANPENPSEILNPTCAGHWSPFTTPDEYRAQGIANPYDCHVEVPEAAQNIDMNRPDLRDELFYDWFDARFVGSECMVDLRINSCNLATIAENGGTSEGLACQERGDMRFNLLSYVNQPGTAFLGVATLRGDPVTGEIRAGDANIGGPALDGYRTRALQEYDLINGLVTDRNFLVGEDVRDYLSNVGRIQQAAAPVTPFITGVQGQQMGMQQTIPSANHNAIMNRMDNYLERGELLAGPEGRARTYVDRLGSLAGTDLERRLFSGEAALAMAGIDQLPENFEISEIPDAIMDQVSPFRNSAGELLDRQRDMETRISNASVFMPNEFVDASVSEFVNRHRDWPRARLEIVLDQLLYYQTQLHELGHCLGLRHDFGASADTNNYDDDYYIINNRFPNPVASDFDVDGEPGLGEAEQLAFQTEYRRVKDLRELAGIDRWMNSSIMEYTAQWYERTATTRGAGRYDHAAVNSGYGDLIEINDNAAGLSIEEISPLNTERIWAKFYNGGETCQVDADCAFSTSGTNAALLLPANTAAGLTQTCQPHPNGAERGNVCSNFYRDFDAIVETGNLRYTPVEYRFCTDDLADIETACHRFDEGDSYREIVANLSEQYDRQYIFTNFRRYRSGFSFGGYLFNRLMGRQYNILQSEFQSLLFNYVNDPEYRDNTGPFGFDDHFLAAADTVNFYAKVITQPEIGSYSFDVGEQHYRLTSEEPNVPSAQLSLPLGMARYGDTEFQRGLTGVQRLELIGIFYEKLFTMQMLTQRGYTSRFARDPFVWFWTNYYDLFPEEMQRLFQGMILDQPETIAPRVVCGAGAGFNCDDPSLVYVDFYTGDPENPRDSVEERYENLEIVDPGTGSFLQSLALTYALSDFPTFFDTTFQNQMFLCVAGEASCSEPAPGDVEGVDYIDYQSEDFGKTFRAFQVEATADSPSQRSITFEFLREANEQAQVLRALQAYRGDFGGAPLNAGNLSAEQTDFLDSIGYALPGDADFLVDEFQRVERRIANIESFSFLTQQMLRRYGIANYVRF